MVIDYKTEALSTTRDRVKSPLEDTQLAFYAALLSHDTLRAAYVNVGEREATRLVEQKEVVQVRDALIEGILHDMARISEGAALPALGEGTACEFCAARGLCRKDFWESP
jgi:ATP-dependent helicase/nuclease subunit B